MFPTFLFLNILLRIIHQIREKLKFLSKKYWSKGRRKIHYFLNIKIFMAVLFLIYLWFSGNFFGPGNYHFSGSHVPEIPDPLYLCGNHFTAEFSANMKALEKLFHKTFINKIGWVRSRRSPLNIRTHFTLSDNCRHNFMTKSNTKSLAKNFL